MAYVNQTLVGAEEGGADVAFGARLKRAMVARHVSQAELGERSGVSQSAISFYMRDEREPLIGTAANIARALNVSLDDLAGLPTPHLRLSVDEDELISLYRRLPNEQRRELALELVRGLVREP